MCSARFWFWSVFKKLASVGHNGLLQDANPVNPNCHRFEIHTPGNPCCQNDCVKVQNN